MKNLILFVLLFIPILSYGKGDTTLTKSDTLSYFISAGGQIAEGNIKNHSFAFSGELKGITGRKDWSIAPSYKYLVSYPYPITPTSTPSKQNEFYTASNIAHRFDAAWKLVLFSEVEHSQLRKINVRANIGVGPGYKFIHTKSTTFEVSNVVMVDYFQSMELKNSIPEKNNKSLRTSLRVKFAYKSEHFVFSSIQIIQPSLVTWTDDPNEFISWSDNTNFRSLNSFDIKAYKNLFFGVSVDYIYQSYLGYIASRPNFVASGIYLSPRDVTLLFNIKYRH